MLYKEEAAIRGQVALAAIIKHFKDSKDEGDKIIVEELTLYVAHLEKACNEFNNRVQNVGQSWSVLLETERQHREYGAKSDGGQKFVDSMHEAKLSKEAQKIGIYLLNHGMMRITSDVNEFGKRYSLRVTVLKPL